MSQDREAVARRNARLVAAAVELGAEMAAASNPATFKDAVTGAFDGITDSLRLVYYLQGAPYGKTEEGFQRWLAEGNEEDANG